MDPMAAIRDTFFQECEEQLAALEAGLLAMDAGERDVETVNAVFRAVHSIKGGAGAFGLEALVRFAHVFETALDDMRAGRLAPEPPVLNLLLRSADVLADLVRVARDGGAHDTARDQALAAELAALASNPETADPAQGTAGELVAAGSPDDGMVGFVFQPVRLDLDLPDAPAQRSWIVRFRPRAELYAKANESAVLLRELARLGTAEIELDASALPAFADLDPEGAYLAWTVVLKTALGESVIREVFEFADGDCDLDVQPADEGHDGRTADGGHETDILDLIRRAHDPAGGTGGGNLDPVPIAGPVVEQNLPRSPPEPPARSAVPAASPTPAAAASAPPPKTTIRVDLDRVDRLIDLVGELVINRAMLAQRILEAGLARSSDVALGLGDLEQLTREMQDSVMAIRAQPVKSVFQRMPRLVREVSAMTGKAVRLLTEGENTEVDKTVIEHLADPLTHMIRNAIDHGLERPEAREASGKPAEGTVRLAARHRSGRIVIEVADDGGGINRSRVRDSAVAKGLIPPDAELSDEEVDNLIFLPGFSTAETVSDISGRGVGMDVVKRSIQALGGRIAIVSRPGLGSTFTMSLPLTLAVLDGMVVSVAGQTLVVPFTAIIETLQPKAGNVHRLINGASVISVRDSYVPLIDVGVSLGFRCAPPEPTAGIALLTEREGGSRAALLIDSIHGQQQVVIKSLETNCQRVPGIAAATILGDGRVALILDIDDVVSSPGAETRGDEHATALFAA